MTCLTRLHAAQLPAAAPRSGTLPSDLRPSFWRLSALTLCLGGLLSGLSGCAQWPVDAPPASDALPATAAASAAEAAGAHALPAAAAVPGASASGAGAHAPRAADARHAAAQPSTPAPSATAPLLAMDPLEPTVPLALDDSAAHADLWARVRAGYAVPELDNDLVRKWERWYADRPDYVQRMTERGGRYLFHVMEEVNRRGLPSELALLPFIESAFNPQAMSSAKASGMWQFIPSTGRDFELRQNVFRDDRRGVLQSTRAALDYLSGLHQMFGDWQLALAAYNWGQGNVQKAIRRNQAAGLPTDYASLRMPDETRNYYPKLQAVKNIVRQPEAFDLELPTLQNHPYFVTVALDRDIDIELAARLAELPLDEFRHLNPQMNKPVILAAGTPQVLLPYDNANAFVQALRAHKGSLATWTAWVAPRTMKTAEVAEQVGMSVAGLRQANNIPAGMLIKAGSTLLVPRDPRRDRDVDEAVADNAMLSLAPDVPPLKRVYLRAGKRGESVATLARRYGLRAADVARWNRVAVGSRFRKGQQITLLLPQRTQLQAAARAKSTAAARAGSPRAASARQGARQTVALAAGGGKSARQAGPKSARQAAAQVAQKASTRSAQKAPRKATQKVARKAAAPKPVRKAAATAPAKRSAQKPAPSARSRVAQN